MQAEIKRKINGRSSEYWSSIIIKKYLLSYHYVIRTLLNSIKRPEKFRSQ